MRAQIKLIIALVLAVAVIGAGIWFAQRLDIYGTSQSSNQSATISRIIFGVVKPLDNGQTRAVDVKEQSSYMTTDKLSLRVTSSSSKPTDLSFNVRLLDQNGKIVEFTPSQILIPSGDNHYCCWQIGQAGTYTLQVFRPDNILSTFKFKIRKATSAPSSKLL